MREVTDAFCPWNAGRWRLTAAPGGPASCVRTGEAAELALDVRELDSVYLGGGSLAALAAPAAAGLVQELRPGALEPASAAFRSGLEPRLPHGFRGRLRRGRPGGRPPAAAQPWGWWAGIGGSSPVVSYSDSISIRRVCRGSPL